MATFQLLKQTSLFSARKVICAPQLNACRAMSVDMNNLNKNLRDMQYAVRGKMAILALQIEKELAAGSTKYPFSKTIQCNIGNPQSVGQKPLTFPRQVVSLCSSPFLLEDKEKAALFPADAVQRAKELMAQNSLGAYSESKGLSIIRQSVASYIKQRDGHPADADEIFLTTGASEGVKLLVNLMINKPTDGIMIPIPQYPLYSASITQFGGSEVGYYLDEENNWSCSVDMIKESYENARKKGIDVRAIAVINPGNPTGQVLEEENIREIVKFCEKENIAILADEVYQSNTYTDKPFVSFKKVLRDLNANVELVSFHSISKGMLGECGFRGGYMELVNFSSEIKDLIYKCVSVNLCSNVAGQVVLDVMVNPPTGESKALFDKEYNAIYSSLKKKAIMLADNLNSLEGITCNPSEGAMYLFPRLHLPQKAIDEAAKRGEAPDLMYCVDLLKATGICVVPGSGFKQVEGTHHLRITFLPQEDEMKTMIERFNKFHNDFMAKYA